MGAETNLLPVQRRNIRSTAAISAIDSDDLGLCTVERLNVILCRAAAEWNRCRWRVGGI